MTVTSRRPKRSASSRLASVDWDFPETGARQAIHNLHPYPARFIPQIPRELIRMFHPGDDSAILDPFCGCGTSLVEASAAGLPAIGVDLNPLAILISKVKTTPLQKPISPTAADIASRAGRNPVSVPPIPRLDHWFEPEIQLALATIISGINAVESLDIRDALRIALSRIIVRVSNQDSDTRYAAVTKSVTQEDVYKLFCKSADLVDAALITTYGGLFPLRPRVDLLHHDILSLPPDALPRPVGLVITSPPYPNAYEYWLYHKYRMYWLGMDPIALKRGEIGARPHYFKKNPQSEADFELQMGTIFKTLNASLPKGGFACFVVGRSIIHRREIDNAALLVRAARVGGFELAASIPRSIAKSKKSFNLSHASINEETVAVFERTARNA
jgi:site-specific DNA-methyltransferase (cytosine-N4-specific)